MRLIAMITLCKKKQDLLFKYKFLINPQKWGFYIMKKYQRKKEKFEITVIHVFTVCILLISFFAFISAHAGEVKTNTKPLFVYSLNSCITDLNKTTPIEKQVPSELIVAQAVIETAWCTSRFANESNNLFGIRQGLKVFETKCDSV